MSKLHILATLHAPKSPRAPPNVTELVELVLRSSSGSRALSAGPDRATVDAATGTGKNVAITIEPSLVRFEGDVDDDDETEETAGAILEKLQAATGWHVTSDRLLGFEPSGKCPSCEVESFTWQEHCAACGLPLDPDAAKKARTPFQARAKRMVDKLLENELIELSAVPGARARLENRLVECLKKEIFTDRLAGERLLGVLMNMDAVEEVFGDEMTILAAF
ncbi:hypothetical protein BH09MYX1_BH09MYX1_05360 [soil metagenome]